MKGQLRWRNWNCLHVLRDHLERFLCLEHELTCEEEIRNASQRVDVRASIHFLAKRHLRRHVSRGSECHLTWNGYKGLIDGSVRHRLHQTEVEHFDKVVTEANASKVNVRGLDVAVDQSLGVSFLERVAHLS